MLTSPFSYSKVCDTSRPPIGQRATTGADLGTVCFVDNAELPAKRNRFISKLVSKHRPSGIADGFRHFGFHQSGWADVTNHDMSVLTDNSCAFDMQEMPALSGNLGLNISGATFLFAPLIQSQLFLRGSEKLWRLDLGSVAHSGESFQAKINPNGEAILFFPIWQLDLDVDKPMSLAIAGQVPRFRISVLWNGARQPKPVVTTKKTQSIPVQFSRTFEIAEWNPVEVALGRPEARRLWKTCAPRIGKLGTNRINRVGVNTKFFGHTSAQIGKIERRRTLDSHPGAVSGCGNAVSFATIIPDEINRSSLRPKRTTNGFISILDSVLVRQYHRKGRLSGNDRSSSRDCATLQASTVPINLPHFCLNINKGAAFLPGLNAGVSSRNIG